MIMSLALAAKRVSRSVRTLRRWNAEGMLRIYPGGYVLEKDVVAAEAAIRKRHLNKKYGES